MKRRVLPQESPHARREPPEKRAARPGWFFFLDHCGDVTVGDWVTIDGIDGIGRVVEIMSHRLAGGLVLTVEFPQAIWIGARPREVSSVRFTDPTTNPDG
jgi:hypothetical protein